MADFSYIRAAENLATAPVSTIIAHVFSCGATEVMERYTKDRGDEFEQYKSLSELQDKALAEKRCVYFQERDTAAYTAGKLKNFGQPTVDAKHALHYIVMAYMAEVLEFMTSQGGVLDKYKTIQEELMTFRLKRSARTKFPAVVAPVHGSVCARQGDKSKLEMGKVVESLLSTLLGTKKTAKGKKVEIATEGATATNATLRKLMEEVLAFVHLMGNIAGGFLIVGQYRQPNLGHIFGALYACNLVTLQKFDAVGSFYEDIRAFVEARQSEKKKASEEDAILDGDEDDAEEAPEKPAKKGPKRVLLRGLEAEEARKAVEKQGKKVAAEKEAADAAEKDAAEKLAGPTKGKKAAAAASDEPPKATKGKKAAAGAAASGDEPPKATKAKKPADADSDEEAATAAAAAATKSTKKSNETPKKGADTPKKKAADVVADDAADDEPPKKGGETPKKGIATRGDEPKKNAAAETPKKNTAAETPKKGIAAETPKKAAAASPAIFDSFATEEDEGEEVATPNVRDTKKAGRPTKAKTVEEAVTEVVDDAQNYA
jgi:hypothetical protein